MDTFTPIMQASDAIAFRGMVVATRTTDIYFHHTAYKECDVFYALVSEDIGFLRGKEEAYQYWTFLTPKAIPATHAIMGEVLHRKGPECALWMRRASDDEVRALIVAVETGALQLEYDFLSGRALPALKQQLNTQ